MAARRKAPSRAARKSIAVRRISAARKNIERAEARTRRQLVALLREVTRRLGRFEAEGERRWRALAARSRREALAVLRRLEKEIERSGPKPLQPKRKLARRRSASSARMALASGGGI